MDLYLKVRHAHFEEGLSGRQIARDFGISRDSVSKMLAHSEPPGYRRTAPNKRPKLDPFAGRIDQWLAEDKARPRKQRHTAKRIFERLRDECEFDGGYTIVKDYVRSRKRGSREMFVPLSHPPGHGQADFGEALVVIGGVEKKACFFALDLPHSDACYIRAYRAANTEAWLDGHVHAFAFFGAVPRSECGPKRPDGHSIVLERQPGADRTGYAGLEDGVDHHWGGVLRAALLSTLLNIGAELGTDDDDPIASAIRDGAKDTIGDAGRKIVRRQIDIPPTLTIRPGFPVRVIVTRDLILEPQGGH